MRTRFWTVMQCLAFTILLFTDVSGNDSFTYTVTEIGEPLAPLPNVILMIIDDMGQGDSQAYNPRSAIDMPNLESLAAAGMRFTHAHSTAALCSPTRYSLMTGNYPYRGRHDRGVWESYKPNTMILQGQQTLGHLMQAAGYRTAFVGKMHNGGAFWNEDGTGYTRNVEAIDFTRPFDRGPTQFGFDDSFVLPGGLSMPPYAFFRADRLVRYRAASDRFAPFVNNQTAHKHLVSVRARQAFNGGQVGRPGHAMNNYDSRQVGPILAREALSFIDHHVAANSVNGTHRPFFLYYATPALHGPHTPPVNFNANRPQNVDDADDPEGTRILGVTRVSGRTDMVYEGDVVLGALLAKLREKRILGDTLIIVTSDNGASNAGIRTEGDQLGDRIETGTDGTRHINAQGVSGGVPLRAFKGHSYEGGHRVPLIMRWGDGTRKGSTIKPRSVSNQLIGLQDIMATLAALTGQTLAANQANDSFNFLPVLLGRQSEDRPIRNHMIIQGSPPFSPPGKMNRALYEWDQNGNLWKLTLASDLGYETRNIGAGELFNLTADPGERTNLSTRPNQQSRVSEMTERYRALIRAARTAPPLE